MEIGKIYWIKDEEVYYHISRMRYSPVTKRYFTLVNEDTRDPRALFYWPNKGGDFNLVVSGRMGEMNDSVLKDTNWDKSIIYTKESYGYMPSLLQMFKDNFGRPKRKV